MDLPLKRIGNRHLMEAFGESGFEQNSLLKLNRCRLHLQLHTISDIVDGSGESLCRLALKGTSNKWEINLFDWPIQKSPDKKHWALWKRAIRITFPHQQRLPVQPLGQWIGDNKNDWQWFIDEQRIFFRDNGG